VAVEHTERRAGDVRDTYASIERAQVTLGYHPQVSLGEGLKAEVEWLSEVVESSDPT